LKVIGTGDSFVMAKQNQPNTDLVYLSVGRIPIWPGSIAYT